MSLATILAAVVDGFQSTFRAYETDNVPASGAHKVSKAEARGLASLINDGLQYLSDTFFGTFTGTGSVYDTKAHLDADLVPAANVVARVIADSTAANNGYYKKVGGTGTGSWSFLGADPAVAANEDAQDAADAAQAALDDIGVYLQVPRGVIAGDSTGERNHSPLAPTFNTQGDGELVQAHQLWPYFEMEAFLDVADVDDINGCNRARSGTNANQVLVSEVRALAPSFVYLTTGINSIVNGYTGAQTAAQIQASAEEIRATGCAVIVRNILPNSNSAYHAGIIAANAALATWVAGRPAGIILADAYSIYANNPASPTDASPKTGYLVDGTHQSPKGASAFAPTLVACIKQVVRSLVDVRPRGEILVDNNLFTGSGGSLAGSATGVAPDQWNLQRTGAAHTCLGAQTGGHFQVTYTGGGSFSAGDGFFVSRGFPATAIDLVDGTWYQWSLVLDFDAWAGWQGCRISTDLGQANALTGAATDDQPTGAGRRTYVSAPVQADGDSASDFLCHVYCDASAASTGTVKFIEARLCEVSDPFVRHGL